MKRVLVALDRSPRSATVLARAATIAHAAGAELYLMHAIGIPTDLPPDAFRSSPNELIEQWRATSVRDLEKRAASIEDPALVVHILVCIGSPWSAICAAARENDVDLVVLGSHGYGAVDHLLGTTAAKVVTHSDRSVLVVREARAGAPTTLAR